MAKSIRVYELAKELGIDSKEVINALGQMGTSVKNHMAALDDASVDAVRKRFSPPAAQKVAQPAAKVSQPAVKTPAPAPKASVPAPKAPAPAPSTPARPMPGRAGAPQGQPTQSPAQGPTARQSEQRQLPRETGQRVPTQQSAQQQPVQRPPQGSYQRPGGGSQSRPQFQGRGGSPGGGGGGGYRRFDNRRDSRHPAPPPRPSQPERQTGARHVTIQGAVGVRDLSSLIGVPTNIILRTLMSLGTLISINQSVPPEIAVKVAEKLGCVVTLKEPEITQEQAIAEELSRPDDAEAAVARPPVVTVMGHVDHGKTSLLDAIRHTNVTAREAGGITQHIGASVVEHGDNRIIFLDTPGHEAFTAMRARGAQVTDVAVLVVAADDGVMPQTLEAINHAKAAGVPIIVALNKIDKPGAKPDRVKQQLSDNGLVPEDWGGDTVVVPVSARTGEGVSDLLEMIILVSEMQEIKTDPTRKGRGHIIESEMDKGKGPVATAIIKAGSLKVGDVIITDTTWGRIRVMFDARGRQVKKAGPATPVEIVGLEDVPQAGDVFLVVDDEKTAKEVTERRKLQKRDQDMQAARSTMTLEDLFAKDQPGQARELKVIVKGDVQGSLEAILQALGKMEGGEVKLDVIHSGVGGIIESDVTLAKASGARILGFNVRPFGNAAALAEQGGVDIRTYRVIYDLLDDVGNLLKGLVKPKTEEVVLGRIEVRQTFHVPKVGTVAGCYVTEGKVPRSASVRLLRNGVVVYEGKMASLKRFKDDVSEVSAGYECGLGLDKFQDVQVGDVVEAFAMKEVQPA
ncbi:MAG: translation initiation factor IF-2 [Bacillota bacterium]